MLAKESGSMQILNAVGLNSVEIGNRRIPVYGQTFLAFGIVADEILLDNITIKASMQRLFKGKSGM